MLEKLVNRVQEVAVVEEFMTQPQTHPHIQILSTQPHSGLSYFLKYCSNKEDSYLVSLYADGAKHEGNSLFAQLGIELFRKYKDLWKKFIRVQETHAGRTRTREVSAAISESIPYIGRVMGKGVDLKYPTLSLSSYPSIAAELLCEFLVELSKKHQICLFLDNVQELDDWSAHLLSVTVGRAYKGIRYVAGFVMRETSTSNALDRFALKSKDIGYGITSRVFPKPDEEFIYQYALASNLNWSSSQCAAIAAATGGDIYRIRAAIAAMGGSNLLFPKAIKELSPVEQTILALLAIARQNLRLSDILALCMGDTTIFVEDEREVHESLARLSAVGQISQTSLPDGDCLITLQPSSDSVMQEMQNSFIEILHLKGQMYDYFSRVEKTSGRHSNSEVAPLLYRLAKKVDPENIDLRLRDIIRLSLQMGSRSIAEEFIDRAVSPSRADFQTLQDYIAKLAFLVSIKRFERILELIEKSPRAEWQQLRLVQIFKGIALNRCRLHSDSEKILAKLSDNPSSLEELVILISYRIVGRIHDNDTAGARELFLNYRDILSKASNYGYFLRNGADVCEGLQATDILTEAIRCHEKNKDTFGIATTLCNRGAKLAQMGFPEEGLRDVEQAYDLLEVFGVHHLGIVLGNLAHCLLYLEMFEMAEQTCRKALRYMGKDLPRVYTLLNLAAAQLLQNKRDLTIETVKQAVSESEQLAVDRTRQKAYLNGALIALLAESPATFVESLCIKALQHPDRWNPIITIQRIAEIRRMLAEDTPKSLSLFFTFYSPCSLLYWYQNPLEGLPLDFLSLETVPEDTSNHLSI